ncbi:flagellar hook-associated protein FlgK [Oceanobacillus bengalensis]|uniref:Flagellar hook-associated protein 1 n=1 Tax=Oceanobacillus bengalensis TaxID=1435466 RepID=A0A494Z866_9BACI|nr:flagellar hook-associated protein FlgK [Oceanobacillus bengalensis]RKQ18217.1 flagellar hook-associated protein FlgK [Oceanobacillus bengalensis]
MSTFHGLEMAKQALFAQQSALYTTGHNIANANTEGYTRQRVDFETASPYPSASRNRPLIAGQIGTGVNVGSIQRIRNEFLDTQFRGENSLVGYWETKSNSFSRMENVLKEPSETGLSTTMDQFWQSLQDLSANPENSGARSVVIQRGQALADTFNYLSTSLRNIRGDLKQQIDTSVSDMNTTLKQIDEINNEVKKLEVHGYVPNDLYDRRDKLIDQLSKVMDIDVKYTESSNRAKDVAAGVVTISVQDSNGNSINLVDGAAGGYNEVSVQYLDSDADSYRAISAINIVDSENGAINATLAIPPKTEGSLNGLIDAYGYSAEDGESTGDYIDMMKQIDDMAFKFAEKFNAVHGEGNGIEDSNDGNANVFFEVETLEGAAGSIKVNQAIVDNPDLFAASTDETTGNGNNALRLANVFNDDLTFENGEVTSIKDFYESVIGELGVRAQEANRMEGNSTILLSQVENQRMSVSAVSLDEEMTNMLKFQHAYNAAARSLTATDEMLDKIINSMGLVGR